MTAKAKTSKIDAVTFLGSSSNTKTNNEVLKRSKNSKSESKKQLPEPNQRRNKSRSIKAAVKYEPRPLSASDLPTACSIDDADIGSHDPRPRTVIVNDKMQEDYQYELTEPEGRNFDPFFKPQLTPKEMLAMGIFGGRYMRDCVNEFPASWFRTAKFAPGKSDPSLNYYKVSASMPLKVWKDNGWINDQDPRGWFQWYCRYYVGRRGDDDKRQIARWRAYKRHVGAILKNKTHPDDHESRARERQCVLHWAYDPRLL